MGEKVHVNVFHKAVGDCAAACAEGVSPFVNDDKFSVIKDSFNDDNTEILLLLLNYHYAVMLSLALVLGPWLSLRTIWQSLVLSLALSVWSLVLALALKDSPCLSPWSSFLFVRILLNFWLL